MFWRTKKNNIDNQDNQKYELIKKISNFEKRIYLLENPYKFNVGDKIKHCIVTERKIIKIIRYEGGYPFNETEVYEKRYEICNIKNGSKITYTEFYLENLKND